ncbi:MAG: ATP synthase F1 subunit gamma [Candidatus Magasanikbacteria bacterium]
MSSGQTREIKSKIESVENTKQMTKAMQMVAASKMQKAVDATENTRLYARLARELMSHLAHIEEPGYDLLDLRPVDNVLVILISSNRGLCGNYNSKLFAKTQNVLNDKELISRHRVQSEREIPEVEGMPEVDILAVGKKSAEFAHKKNYEVPAVFDELSEKPTFEDTLPISKMALEDYKEGEYDRIVVSYTHFEGAMSQEVKMRQVLPISPKDLKRIFEGKNGNKAEGEAQEEDYPIETYVFEPSIEEIVEEVLPRLVEIEIYQAILNAAASEHSSRMIAMKNATENAEDMVEELTLSYNQARQAAITREISEIAAGAEALKED